MAEHHDAPLASITDRHVGVAGDISRTSLYMSAFSPIEKTPYFNKALAEQDPVRARIQGLLADVTLPVSIVAPIRAEKERLARRRREKEAEADRVLGREPQEQMLSLEEEIAMSVREAVNTLCTTKTMIELRDAAQDLDTRYQKIVDKGYGSADSYFSREASSLHERMQQYAADYFEYPNGRVKLETLYEDTTEDIDSLKRKVATAVRIQRDKPNYEKSKLAKVEISLPVQLQETKNRWDREEIDLQIDANDKILGVTFDELFDHALFVGNLDQLAQAYRSGQALTPSEVQLLVDYDYIDLPPSTEQDILKVPKATTNLQFAPIYIFPHLLPPNLAEKLAGQSGEHFYATHSKDVGPIKINNRLHDYGSMEFVINLDTRNLTNEEVYQLIGIYLDTLKAFPRVPKSGKVPNS